MKEKSMGLVRYIENLPGLIAFWRFPQLNEGTWQSAYDSQAAERSYPLYLRRAMDPQLYHANNWPYQPLEYDSTGPIGRAIHFQCGHVFGEVPRYVFDKGALDIHGRTAFTMIAYVKYVGQRLLVAGVWDAGKNNGTGWDRNAGQRQYAIFTNLFESQSTVGHLSATGAATYPQSNYPGSQFARFRAIDGDVLHDGQWGCVATTFDPTTGALTAYLNGIAHPHLKTDPVERDVYQIEGEIQANPTYFKHAIYHPTRFLMKFDGYDVQSSGVFEHRLNVNLQDNVITYENDRKNHIDTSQLVVSVDVQRANQSILFKPLQISANHSNQIKLPHPVNTGDHIVARLIGPSGQIGNTISKEITKGAPFTIGRTTVEFNTLEHGSDFFVDGVAVFNRVLTDDELRKLAQ